MKTNLFYAIIIENGEVGGEDFTWTYLGRYDNEELFVKDLDFTSKNLGEWEYGKENVDDVFPDFWPQSKGEKRFQVYKVQEHHLLPSQVEDVNKFPMNDCRLWF